MSNICHFPLQGRKPQPQKRFGEYDRQQQQLHQRAAERRAFKGLTQRLVMDRHRRGVLEPAVVEALLLAAGFEP